MSRCTGAAVICTAFALHRIVRGIMNIGNMRHVSWYTCHIQRNERVAHDITEHNTEITGTPVSTPPIGTNQARARSLNHEGLSSFSEFYWFPFVKSQQTVFLVPDLPVHCVYFGVCVLDAEQWPTRTKDARSAKGNIFSSSWKSKLVSVLDNAAFYSLGDRITYT